MTNVTFQIRERVFDLCDLEVPCPAGIAGPVAWLRSASVELLDLTGMDVLVKTGITCLPFALRRHAFGC